MSWLGWRLVQVGVAFTTAMVLPVIALIVVTGLVHTGMVGLIALAAWLAVTILLVRVVVRLRR